MQDQTFQKQNHMKRNLKVKNENNFGFTLVELVVCFALLGILLVCMTQVISSTASIFYKAKSVSEGTKASDMVMVKITEEIEEAVSAADGDEIPVISKDEDDNFTSISLKDKEGKNVVISADRISKKSENRYLKIHDISSGYNIDSTKAEEAPDWTYDTKAYMGYHITKFQMSYAYDAKDASKKNYQKNVIKVVLTMDNPKYESITVTRYIKMYQIDIK